MFNITANNTFIKTSKSISKKNLDSYTRYHTRACVIVLRVSRNRKCIIHTYHVYFVYNIYHYTESIMYIGIASGVTI